MAASGHHDSARDVLRRFPQRQIPKCRLGKHVTPTRFGQSQITDQSRGKLELGAERRGIASLRRLVREIDVKMPTQRLCGSEGLASVIGAQMRKQTDIAGNWISHTGVMGVTPRQRTLPGDDQQNETQPNRVG